MTARLGLAVVPDLRQRLLVVLAAALLAALAYVAIAAGGGGTAHVPGATGSAAKLPAELQAAIDRTLAGQPETSPGGVRLWWGKAGAVSFASRRAAGERVTLRPLTLGRTGSGASSATSFSAQGFVFGKAGTTETLGAGVTATYATTKAGFEQRFTVAGRPAGSGRLVLTQALSGGLRAAAGGGGTVSFENRAGSPVLTYGGLRVTDASGRVLPSRLEIAAAGRSLAIVIDDRGASYPLTVDPSIIAWTSSPVGTFTGASGSGEALGYSVAVSADGQTAVVGVPLAGSDDGEVFVYTESGGSWPTTPTQTLTDSGSETLGFSVAVSADGRTIVAGAPYASGAAVVYTESGGSWSNTPASTTLPGTGGEELGFSVAVSADGQTVVAGAPLAGSDDGAAVVYTQSGGSWPTSPTQTFTGSGSDYLGWSVAVSADGQTVVAGAPNAGSDDGAAVVYTQSGGSWPTSPTQTFTGSGSERLGYSVAVSADGRTVVAGAPYAGSDDGAAVVYTESGGSWSTATTFSGAGGSGETLGYSVAVSADGQTVIAGAPYGGGEVFVYTESGGSWPTSPTQTFTGGGSDYLGWSVAVSADGQTVVAGAPYAGSGDGAALVYAQPGRSWSSNPAGSLTDPSGTSGEQLGYSVAVSADGQTAVVGAPYAGSYDGEVFVYTESGGSWPTTPTQTLTGSGSETLGFSVAVSADGRTIVAGAPYGGGAAVVYTESGGSWSNTPASTTLPGTGGGELGYSVAVSADGRTVVAGAPYAGSDDGAAVVYTESGGSWSTATTFSGASGSGETLGYSVAVSADGQTVVAGAPLAGSDDGAAVVYTQSGGSWPTSPTQTFTGSGSDYLGWSVAVSADGRTVVAGAPYAGSDDGAAVVYTQSGGSWPTSPTQTFTGSGRERLGWSVAVSADGQTVVAGAPLAGSDDGAAVVYTQSGGSWSSTPTQTFTGTSGEQLGSSVAVSADGQTVIAGAPGAGAGSASVYELLYTTSTAPASVSPPVTYSTSTQSITLTTTVTSPAGTVTQGQVTFTVQDGSGEDVGSATGTVSDGSAQVSYTLPAGTAAGEYTIDASYSDSSNGFASSGNVGTFTIGPADTTTTAGRVGSVSYSESEQSVNVSASVTSLAGTVNEGSVTFTIYDDAYQQVGAPVSTAVSNGSASTSYTLPGGTPPGLYTLVASYSDGSGADFSASPFSSRSFTIGALSQLITFVAPSSPAVAGTSATLSATGGASGQPVEFSVDGGTSPSDACSVTQTGPGAGTVAYEHAGSCVIDANQAAGSGGGYVAATQVSVTVQVQAAASTVSVPAPPDIVFGQAATVTATISEANGNTAAGSVQFAVDGTAVGSPVTVVGGTATSPDLNPAGTLAPGAHAVVATFTPADATVQAPGSATVTQTVDRAATTTSVTVGAHTVTATVTAVAPGAGTPSGQVTFSVDGESVGSASLSGGTATLDHTVPTGATRAVAASYGGDTDFTGSSASTSRSDPTIVAHLSSAQRRSRDGWYRTPVTVRFTCATHGAPLTGPCPAAVRLSRNGAGQSVTRTVTATNGGAATAVVSGIKIDRIAPSVRVTGVRNGGTYDAPGPTSLACRASDKLSGVASCRVRLRRTTSHSGLELTTVRYTLQATDRAGNSTTRQGSYRLLGIYLQGATYAGGVFDVRPDRVYTLIVAHSRTRPRYIDAAPAPGHPAGDDNYLHPVGTDRWAIGVLTPPIPPGQRWYLGVQIGSVLHALPIREP